MKYHPFAEVWPLLEGPKFDKLVADIKANGLMIPIVTYQDMIIDGRNRDRACAAAGVAPRYEKAKAKTDEEALKLSASLNEHRRHMAEAELALVAAQLSNIKPGGDNKTIRDSEFGFAKAIPNSEIGPISIEKAAELVGVSVHTVNRARAVITHAPDLIPDVKKGKKAGGLALSDAALKALARSKAKKAAAAAKKAVATKPAPGHGKFKRELPPSAVDPEFTGDVAAFVTEYGHVQLMTTYERSVERFGAWAITLGHLARKLKEAQLPAITDIVVARLRKPPTADVMRMRTAAMELQQMLDTANRLLNQVDKVEAEKGLTQ